MGMPCIQKKKQLAIENGSSSDIAKPVDADESQSNSENVALIETYNEKLHETYESTSYMSNEEKHVNEASEKFPDPGRTSFIDTGDVYASDGYGADQSMSHYNPPESVPYATR